MSYKIYAVFYLSNHLSMKQHYRHLKGVDYVARRMSIFIYFIQHNADDIHFTPIEPSVYVYVHQAIIVMLTIQILQRFCL